jgi:hypothetical protein
LIFFFLGKISDSFSLSELSARIEEAILEIL